MATTKYLLPLGISLLVLMIDSAIQLALISSMVGYLHRSGANQYPFTYNGGTVVTNAKPKGLLLNEGHASNGAAGSALVGICFGGFFMIWWLRRRASRGLRKPSSLFMAYTIFSVLALILTLFALSWTFALTNQTKHHSIDKATAVDFQHHAYPLNSWTPGTWTDALLALPVINEKDVSYLKYWRHIINGWKWNAIPMFLIELVTVVLIALNFLEDRKGGRRTKENTSSQDKSGDFRA